MATSEIYGAHALPRDVMSLTNDSQQVLHYIGNQDIGNIIQHISTKRHSRIVIKQVNKEEEKSEGREQKMKTGIINILGISHKR